MRLLLTSLIFSSVQIAIAFDLSCLLSFVRRNDHLPEKESYLRLARQSKSKRFQEDIAKSQHLYRNNKENVEARNFDIQFQRLLDSLNPKDAIKLKATLTQNYRPSNQGPWGAFNVGNAFYDVISRKIIVQLPQYLLGTEVENILKFHELTHAMNHIIKDRELSFLSRLKLESLRDNFLDIQFEEFSAMTAEWQYLQSIPSSTRLEIIDLLEKDQLIVNQFYKDFLVHVFNDKSENPIDYIQKWREWGRYNDEEISFVASEHYKRKRIQFGKKAGIAILSGTTFVVLIRSICGTLSEGPTDLYFKLCGAYF